jgi:hypothetical protein
VKTTYVSNGNGGATYSTVESAYIGGGFSLFGGGTAGVVVPNFNSASASVPFGLGGFLPKGFSAALGLGGDIGPNNIGLSLGVGYAAGLLGNGNKNNSASHTLPSGGC